MTNYEKEISIMAKKRSIKVISQSGHNYKATPTITLKGQFTIVEVREGKGSDAGWGRLKSGAGWISLDFTSRV